MAKSSIVQCSPGTRVIAQAVMISFYILSTLVLILRLYTSAFVMRRLKMTDYTISIAWGVFSAYFALEYESIVVAAHRDPQSLSAADHIAEKYYRHIGTILYGICIFLVKLSILLQFIEIFTPLNRKDTMYWGPRLLIWANFFFYLAITLVKVFSCHPVTKIWDSSVKRGSCMHRGTLSVSRCAINSASDIIILIFPQTRIWRLHMAWRKRVAVSAAFLIGIFACVSSVMRLVYAVLHFKASGNSNYKFWMHLWAIPETGCGFLCVCLPVLPRLFKSLKQNRRDFQWKQVFQKLLPSRHLRHRSISRAPENNEEHRVLPKNRVEDTASEQCSSPPSSSRASNNWLELVPVDSVKSTVL